MFKKNISILKNVVNALKKKKFSQILYVSSDAVYDENVRIINENTTKRPSSFYGKMHLKRENTLKLHFFNKLCVVRPTMIFGKNDEKAGYGPDKFLNQITQLKNIYLFGIGEEKRDHISIDNVVATIYCCLKNNFRGSLNVASGKVFSFLDIAKECLKKTKNKKIKIKLKPRRKLIPYGGYREFDIRELKLYMNTNKFVKLKNYIRDY
jgi:nucleoside-diphosphate-sugar epimerase